MQQGYLGSQEFSYIRLRRVAHTQRRMLRAFCKNETGFGLIEAALVLPLVLVLLFGIIEFGFLMYNRSIALDTMNAVSQRIAVDYNNFHKGPANNYAAVNSGVVSSWLDSIAQSSGMGVLNLRTAPNCLSIRSTTSATNASSSSCDSLSPIGPASLGLSDPGTSPYFYVVRGVYNYTPMTPFGSLLTTLGGGGSNPYQSTIQMSFVRTVPVNTGNGLPKCNPGQTIVADSNGVLICQNLLPTCQQGKALIARSSGVLECKYPIRLGTIKYKVQRLEGTNGFRNYRLGCGNNSANPYDDRLGDLTTINQPCHSICFLTGASGNEVDTYSTASEFAGCFVLKTSNFNGGTGTQWGLRVGPYATCTATCVNIEINEEWVWF